MADKRETVGAQQDKRSESYTLLFRSVPCPEHEGPFVACSAHEEYEHDCPDCFRCEDCRTGLEAYMEKNPEARVLNLTKYPDAA